MKEKVGNYYISKSSIGEGSGGKVFLAADEVTGKQFAVKIVDRKSRVYQEALKEVRLLQDMEHKHVISLAHYEEDEQYLYIFTEFMEQQDVYSFIKKNGKLPEDQAFKLFKQMVSSINYLHEKKICHHDVKCENFCLDSKFQIKLIDFGYAVEFGSAGQLIKKSDGSPLYSAPEVLFRRPHTENVDIFSLGVSLYFMICGCFPFCEDENSTSFEELCRNIRAFDLQFPMDVSCNAQDIITKMLAKENRLSITDIRNHYWFQEHKQCRPSTP